MTSSNQAEDTQKELRRLSIMMTAISCLLVLITIINAILAYYYIPYTQELDYGQYEFTYNNELQSYSSIYFFHGLIGAFWGIIAGPIGIRMSYSNNLSQTKCLWRAYVPLIFISMLGSTIGLILSISVVSIEKPPESLSYFGAISSIEIILLFVLWIVSSWAAWSFGCSRCQLNQSLEQEIIANPIRTVDNEYIDFNENNKKNTNEESNVYDAYNESFESNEYDQYDEYNQYEPYRQRYAEYPG